MPADEQWRPPVPEVLPRPSAWPVVVAAGVSGFALGMVTHWIIMVGSTLVFLVGMGGWVYEMFRASGEADAHTGSERGDER